MSDNIGLFDLDGSLADYEGQLRADLMKIASPSEPPIVNLWTLEKTPYMGARMKLIKNQPGWWAQLPTLASGMTVFNIAKQIGFMNTILTVGPLGSTRAWTEKVDWCHARFGNEIEIHITRNKGRVYGKFLYDDYPEYIELWLKHRPRGLVVMPIVDSNKDFYHPQVVRWTGQNVDEITHALQVCYLRKPLEPLVIT